MGDNHPSRGMLALILGLVGITIFPPLAPFAWVVGRQEQQRVRAGLIRPDGAITAGWALGILGSLGLVLWLLGIMAMLTLLAMGIFQTPPLPTP